jgi:hypothetical protein
MRLLKIGDIRVRFWIPGNIHQTLNSKSRRDTGDFLEKGIAPIGKFFISTRVVITSDFPPSRIQVEENNIFIEELHEFNVFISEKDAEEKFEKLLELLADVCRDLGRHWIYIENDSESFLFFPDEDTNWQKQIQSGKLMKRKGTVPKKGGAMTDKERDRILEQYTHTIEEFNDEEKLLNSPEALAFEEAYADDAELPELMRRAKQKKLDYLFAMSQQKRGSA